MTRRARGPVGWLLTLVVVAAFGVASHAAAQESVPEPPTQGGASADPTASGTRVPEDLTEASIQARITSIEAATDLQAEARTQLLDLWRRALGQVRARDAQLSQAAEYGARRDESPARLSAVRAQLAEPPPPPGGPGGDATLAELETALRDVEAERDAVRLEVASVVAERAQRVARRTEIPKLLVSARERMVALAPVTPSGAGAQEAEAARVLGLVSRAALEAEILALEAERESYDARAELIAAREDLASRRLVEVEGRHEKLQARVGEARRLARERDQREADLARRTARNADPLLADLTRTNAELLGERNTRAEARDRGARVLNQLEADLAAAVARHERTLARFDRSDPTSAMASALRRERASLTEVDDLRRDMARWQLLIGEMELALLSREDDRADLSNIDQYVEDLLGRDTSSRTAEELEALTPTLVELAEARRSHLDALIAETGGYLDLLVDLDAVARQLVESVKAHERFIDERILWVRSTDVVGPRVLRDLVSATTWLLRPSTWADLPVVASAHLEANPGPLILGGLVVLVLALGRSWARRRLKAVGQGVRDVRLSAFSESIRALFLTLFIAALMPSVFILAGSLWSTGQSAFATAWGDALLRTGGFLAPFTLLHAASRNLGLGEVHLRWPDFVVLAVRRAARMFSVVVVPCLVLALLLGNLQDEAHATSLGRVLFVVVETTLALMAWRLLKRGGPVHRHLLAQPTRGWLLRLHPLMLVLGVGLPLALVLGLLLGYQYTSVNMGHEALDTCTLLIVVILAHGLAMRWLAMEKRKARLELARMRREEAQRASTGEVTAALGPDEADLHLDPGQVDSQARGLLRAIVAFTLLLGLWALWADVLPAFGGLRRVVLWTTNVEAPAGDDGTGAAVMTTVEISLADLLLSLGIFGLTMSAARNIPGFLDVAILRRLPIQVSTGYALSTLARYLISMLGVVIAFQALGVGWAKVQWLVAAMSLGLGFGLQEIFGNFVCGLILLFERRIRVDDVVTVGDISGKVLRIRVLATTVRDWDRKEYVVPNKELITGKLLNWTLTDSVNRIIIKVGVAYGSDTALALQLLLEVGKTHPLVLGDPEPVATFEGFGDSSLALSLRCFLPDLENRLAVISDLHQAVDARFKQAGLEIAFPQLDLHVRSMIAPPDASTPS